MKLSVKELSDHNIHLTWDKIDKAESYRVYWADKNTTTIEYKCIEETKETNAIIPYATHVNHYFKVAGIKSGKVILASDVLKTEVKKVFHEQLEKLSRGLIAVKTKEGVFLSWRLMLNEVTGYRDTGLTGTNFNVYKNGNHEAYVTDSTNYMDMQGTMEDLYSIEAVSEGIPYEKSEEVKACSSGDNYIDIPLQIPSGGINLAGEPYSYNANDMSVGDIDGDGEYEYIVKWDPTNAKDVSHVGYTGNCYIDCYKLDGRLLWRLDMGVNIRAGAHYTQFMVYDFNGDGKAEISVKTAPGTKMTFYNNDGTIKSESYITMPDKDIRSGFTNEDDYRMSSEDYFNHMVTVFMNWREHDEVIAGNWPSTLEECFGIEPIYTYPLSKEDAVKMVDYFMDVYAIERSPNNKLRKFEGFILEGPEYLTMFSGIGEELETIDFPHPRVDDGLLWGDYEWNRIEPGNRVDRFLSGVAYLDGEKPYLIVCRGYYTRTTIVAYSFFDGHFKEYWNVDSGFVKMSNPFGNGTHEMVGSDPVYGIIAGQGNHSLSTADVDNDGCQEIIYGACVIDNDGSVLYSSYGYLQDGTYAKFGHGDAMHVADIDPDRPGLEMFNVFESGKYAPYGYALRDASNGEVIYGEYAEKDLGRCMIGDINPNVRGLQTWVYQVQSCKGDILSDPPPGTNQSIRFAGDMSTQILEGVNIFGGHQGIINDNTRWYLLKPEEVATNNGTKGNACLIADIFGDFREELLLRKADNSAIRIFISTEITNHKLFTLMHDTQYRTGVAWQNNCYNQPCYTKYYFASDTDFEYVLPISLPKTS